MFIEKFTKALNKSQNVKISLINNDLKGAKE